MKKYRFRIDKPEPTDEHINRHKDFARLQANYQRMTKPIYKTPLYKNPKVFLVLLLILVMAYIIAEFTLEHSRDNKKPGKDDSVKTETTGQAAP